MDRRIFGLETEYGIELPRRLQIDFARQVQAHTDTTGAEVTATELWDIFQSVYLAPHAEETVRLAGYESSEIDETSRTSITLAIDGAETTTGHEDVGPVEALTIALREHEIEVDVLDLHQTSIGSGNDSQALTLIEYRHPGGTGWVAGRADSVLAASLRAITTAANTTAPAHVLAAGR